MPNLYAKPITPAELAACRRVADYLRRVALPFLADPFADRDERTESKRESRTAPHVEFYLTFYRQKVAHFDRKMVLSLRSFAAGETTADELKTATDEYIKAHTVVWLNGVPHWKVEEIN